MKSIGMVGSCTEAQVSHVLSERFSRNPMGWSEEGLGKLSKLRVYEENGGKISAKDFKGKREKTYDKYADKVIEEAMSGAIDWSIFDKTQFIFDGTSGTQTAIHGIGAIKNMLWS